MGESTIDENKAKEEKKEDDRCKQCVFWGEHWGCFWNTIGHTKAYIHEGKAG